MNPIDLLKSAITDPEKLLLAFRLVRDLMDGKAELDAETRGELQVQILELEAKVSL